MSVCVYTHWEKWYMPVITANSKPDRSIYLVLVSIKVKQTNKSQQHNTRYKRQEAAMSTLSFHTIQCSSNLG